jgi:hypothetical protein
MYPTAGAPPPAPPVCARARPDGPASDPATLRQKPRLYLAVNLEQLQHHAGSKYYILRPLILDYKLRFCYNPRARAPPTNPI